MTLVVEVSRILESESQGADSFDYFQQLRNQLLFSGVDSSDSATLSQNLTSSTLHNQKLLIKKTQIEPKLVDF